MGFSLSAKGLILFACVGLMVAAAAVAEAQGPDPSSGSGRSLPYDEGEAQAIDRMLMCPVCPAVTIDQTQVELAQQMKRLVREMLAQGASRQQVLDFFVERYGPGVLAAPPKAGLNLLAWILPAAGVAAALGALFLVLRAMVGHPSQRVATEPSPQEDLAPYLEVIDQELADLRPGREQPPRGGGQRYLKRGLPCVTLSPDEIGTKGLGWWGQRIRRLAPPQILRRFAPQNDISGRGLRDSDTNG